MSEVNKTVELNEEKLEKVTGGIVGDELDVSLIQEGDWIMNTKNAAAMYRYKVTKVNKTYFSVDTYKKNYDGNQENINGVFRIFFISFSNFSAQYKRCDAPDSSFIML